MICPMYSHESISALKQLFEWSLVDPSNINEEKYLLSKKISEVRKEYISIVKIVNSPPDGLRSRPPPRRAT